MNSDGGTPDLTGIRVQSSDIFGGVIEQMEKLREWDPTNDGGDVTAGAVLQFLGELPNFMEVTAQVLAHVADKSNDAVGQEEGGPEVLAEMSTYVGAAVEPLRDVGVNWWNANQASANRMTSDDEKDAAFDWSRFHAT